MDDLRERIQAANKAYWEDHHPIMSDAEYDKLVEQLKVLNPDDPLISYIGGNKGEVKHDPPMLSLDKVYTHADLCKWIRTTARKCSEVFLVQPKFDGIAGKLDHDDRGWWRLSTRGDGKVGENITDKLPLINIRTNNLIVDKSRDGRGVVFGKQKTLTIEPLYGEIVISDAMFEECFKSGKIKRQDGSLYSTPRNATAGIVGLKDPSVFRDVIPLTFVDYHVYEQRFVAEDLQDEAQWSRIVEEVTSLGFPVDGVVVKIADPIYSGYLGATIHHPRGAMAFKFCNESEQTVLRDIEWNVGMGSITPKAIVDPVTIGGAVIKQASLFNLRYVVQNEFRIGDVVKLERAGDVVPHICVEDHIKQGTEQPIPHKCPCCGKPTQYQEVELVCTNPECPGVLVARLTKGVKELKLDGFGDVTIRQLVNSGIRTIGDILWLTADKLKSILNLSDLMANKLYNNIQNVRVTISAPALLSALAIPRISKSTAASLLIHRGLEAIIDAPIEENRESFHDFGEVGASLIKWLETPGNVETLIQAYSACANVNSVQSEYDETVCFTGKMSVPRNQMEEYAQMKGYRMVNTVTKDLSLLVVADDATSSDKLTKARRYGIQILTESQFRNL